MLSFLVAASSNASSDRFWTGPAIATMAAAAVALGVGLWSGFTTRRIAKDTRVANKRQLQADLRLKQLNEFYEPLAMLRTKSRLLRLSLPELEPDGSRWGLVRHIPEIKADPARARIVEEILSINGKIEELLITKAGLMEGSAPASFDTFMHHSGLLSLAWEHGGELVTDEMQGVPVAHVPFPSEIDNDIAARRAIVRKALQGLVQD